jgi:hypothetical protein
MLAAPWWRGHACPQEEADVRSFKALLVFGLLSALIGSVTLFEAREAYAQQCPNGICPP